MAYKFTFFGNIQKTRGKKFDHSLKATSVLDQSCVSFLKPNQKHQQEGFSLPFMKEFP